MKLIRWSKDTVVNQSELEKQLSREGLKSFIWRDEIGTFYPAHSHPHNEIRWVISGTLIFGVEGEEIVLQPGDRLELPANTPHYVKISDESSTIYLCASKTE